MMVAAKDRAAAADGAVPLRYRSLLSTVGRDVGRAGEKEQSSTLPTGARGTVPRPLVEARGGGASGVV